MAVTARQIIAPDGEAEATPKVPVKPKPRQPKNDLAYYDEGKGGYWCENARQEWVYQSERQLGRYLHTQGFERRLECDNGLTMLENELLRLQRQASIHWAGPLAGYDPGIYDMSGFRVLVTRGRRPITPKKGKYPLLGDFFCQLLGEREYFLRYWLKCSLESLASGPPWRPGQALALAGPRGAGKSLTQELLTEALGGRHQKPAQQMLGETHFNANLFGAEHLALEDEFADSDQKSRRQFAVRFKSFIANSTQNCHPKGGQPIPLTPFWRVSFSLNDGADSLACLPPMHESVTDKIFLLRCFPTTLPFDAENLASRKAFRAALSAQMPAFLYDCLAMKIAAEDIDPRYGCRAWQDPDLVSNLADLEHEERLLELVEASSLFAFGVDVWTGSAHQLEDELRRQDHSGAVGRLLSWPTACGVFLSRLAGKYPSRFRRLRGPDNTKIWEIRLPSPPPSTRPSVNGQGGHQHLLEGP